MVITQGLHSKLKLENVFIKTGTEVDDHADTAKQQRTDDRTLESKIKNTPRNRQTSHVRMSSSENIRRNVNSFNINVNFKSLKSI